MPDGILPPPRPPRRNSPPTATDRALVQHVRRNLVLWSGGTTLVILIALAAALYVAAASSLASAGVSQLDARMATIRGERPDPDDDTRYGFIFGGGGSGTYALILDPDGNLVQEPRAQRPPKGLPYRAGCHRCRDHRA